MKRIGRLSVLVLPILALLAGCSLLSGIDETGESPTSVPQPTPAQATVVPQPTLSTEQIQTDVAPITELRVWIPREIGSRTEAGQQELSSQIRAFGTANSNLEIIIEQKPVDGPGGILSYLRTGPGVAPTILPDLIALPAEMLADTVVQDLVFPLDGLVQSEIVNGLYPAPLSEVTHNDSLYGLPFATVGLTHLVYDPTVVTQTIPLTWSRFISDSNHTMVLPVGGSVGGTFGLLFYFAEGGVLLDEAGQSILQVEPLTRALGQISLKKENFLQSYQMNTLDEAWQYYQLGLSEFVWVQSEFLMQQQESPGFISNLSQNRGFIPVPGPTDPLIPMGSSWAWSITTPDVARQVLVSDLLAWLVDPYNLASWTSRSQTLPASRDSIQVLAEQDPYFLFAGREMERAALMPVDENSRVIEVLRNAVLQALTTDIPPEVLAEEASNMLRQ